MNAVVTQGQFAPLDPKILESLVLDGDLAKLSAGQRVAFYNYRCNQAGLDPAAQPFSLLRLNNKLVLYANASACQQLCGIHKLSTAITSRESVEGIYMVTARVASPDGRFSENTGAVPIERLKGESLANAMLKATTKAIRRTVLAHLGLGMMDETEVATIPGAVTTPLEGAAASLVADPRGDLSRVDTAAMDRHVGSITDILNMDADEYEIADKLRDYVAAHLQPDNEMYIAVADALAATAIIGKAAFRKYLQTRRA